jgi:hypothetical protein
VIEGLRIAPRFDGGRELRDVGRQGVRGSEHLTPDLEPILPQLLPELVERLTQGVTGFVRRSFGPKKSHEVIPCNLLFYSKIHEQRTAKALAGKGRELPTVPQDAKLSEGYETYRQVVSGDGLEEETRGPT